MRLYNDLDAMNEAGVELWATVLDGADKLALELSERGADLRDARQIAMDAMSEAFSQRIIRNAYKKGATVKRGQP